MTALIGALLNNLISLFIGQCVRYYPLIGRWRVSLKTLVAVYVVVFALQSAALLVMQEYFAADYLGNQILRALSGLIILLIPFFLTRDSFFQNLFLFAVVANYIIIIFGAGNFTELTFGGAFAEKYPYIISTGVTALISIPLLPLLLRTLRRLFGFLPESKTPLWKYIWLIPALFAIMCLMTANIFMGEDFTAAMFVIARLFIGVGMVLTCYWAARTLAHEARTAELTETCELILIRAESLERDLEMQKQIAVGIPAGSLIVRPPFTLNTANRQAFMRDTDLQLNGKEFDLLAYFISRENESASLEEIYQAVWKSPYVSTDSALKGCLQRLREKMQGGGYIVSNVRGKGYRFEKE